ncbi:ribonuclease H-like domain-containing protein [candidate division KSB1 bacterium]|nr:ribonuclease H-like domain-containing protein [candidate division KSB1 bacterium]
MESIKQKLRSLHPHDSLKRAATKHITDEDLAKCGLVRYADERAIYMREKIFPLAFLHGGVELAAFLDITPQDMVLMHNGQFSIPVRCTDFLFFDAETTGLAGGSGTYIFLAGFGYFVADCFIVRQLLLAEYRDEAAFLTEILHMLRRFKGILSFNGKTYDLPLLRTRCVLNKLGEDYTNMEHIDLLHHARRLWKKSIRECHLANVEKRILRFARQDDLPGSEAPKRFFEFQRSGDVELLLPVFKHNAIDLLSLVSIAIHSTAQFSSDMRSVAEFDKKRLYRLLVTHGDEQRAAQLIHSALEKNEPDVLLEYAAMHKKKGDVREAVRVWEYLSTCKKFIEVAYLELAKYYEHIQVDYSKALDIVNRVDRRRQILQELAGSVDLAPLDDWPRRRQRLLRKCAK